MGITHDFVSAKADGGDATLVRPVDWNADHLIEAHSGDTVGAVIPTKKSRGTLALPTIITSGDILREDKAYGYDGANYLFMGASYFKSTGTIAATRVPTMWEVWISTDAAPSVLTKSAMLSASVTAFGFAALTVNTATGNSAFGKWALTANTVGLDNCAFGFMALYNNTGAGASNNCAFGKMAMYANVSGDSNAAFGYQALYSNTTGVDSVAVGYQALLNNDGGDNVAIGAMSFQTATAITNSVAIGYMAGSFETGTNKLFIDSFVRASESDGRIKALVYGIFATTVANQYLTVNGNLITSRDIAFTTSLDSIAVADEVSLGGYDISGGHRALAISSEEVVVVEVDEAKFSHKLPVRINGATYNLMLCAS